MLQRLKVLPFLLLIFTSCSTAPIFTDGRLTLYDIYFKNKGLNLWEKGLVILEKYPEPEYITDLFYIYRDLDYIELKSRIGIIIKVYIENIYSDYSLILDISDEEDIEGVIDVVSLWNEQNIIEFTRTVFQMESSKKKSLSIKFLGSNILSMMQIKKLYESPEKKMKQGAISSGGYNLGREAIPWLTDILFDEKEDLATVSVFSLSKHGTTGFNVLADNLLDLPPRLKLIVINILAYNRVEKAYPYFIKLLENPSPLLEDRILKAFDALGRSADSYIIDSLKTSRDDIKTKLLSILGNRGSNDYISKVLFLLSEPSLKREIFDLILSNNRIEDLNKLVIENEYEASKDIVLYGIMKESELLLGSSDLTFVTIVYMLENLDFVDAYIYLVATGKDENYINDYILMDLIYKDISLIKSIEDLYGKNIDIRKYFDFEKSKFLVEEENMNFYNGMEQWLITGDDSHLEESLTLKETSTPGQIGVEDKRVALFKSLRNESIELIEKYEESKLNAVYSYKQLSYRLKSPGEYLFIRNNLSSLLE